MAGHQAITVKKGLTTVIIKKDSFIHYMIDASV